MSWLPNIFGKKQPPECVLLLRLLLLETRIEKQRNEERFQQIMSAISEFAARQQAFNDRQGVAIDGLVADVHSQRDLIIALQNSTGGITPEDQALLDQIDARSATITAKMEALDAETPPTPPTT
jgi:hypothetical protein